MKYILIIGSLFINLCSQAQIAFFQEVNSVPYERIESCVSTYDSGYALITTYGNFIRVNKNADTLWSKQYNISPNYPDHSRIIETRDSGFLIWQSTHYIQFGRMLIKTDKNGDTLWTRHYIQGYDSYSPQFIIETSDGSFLFTFEIGGGNYSTLAKINSSGNPVWANAYSINQWSDGIAVTELANGDYLLVGKCNTGNIFLMKTDTAGNPIWKNVYACSYSGIGAYIVKERSNGGIIVSGSIRLPGFTQLSAILIATDSLGNIEWSKYYTGNIGAGFNFLTQTFDSGYFVGGGIWDSTLSYMPSAIFKLSSYGTVEWVNFIGDNFSVNKLNEEGGFIVINQIQDHSYVAKTDTSGNNICITDPIPFQIQSDTINLITYPLSLTTFSFQLNYLNLPVTIHPANFDVFGCINNNTYNANIPHQVNIFPNPASKEFIIVNASSEIHSLKLFDIYGKLIYSENGINRRQWTIDCRNFPSGIYFINMQLEVGTIARKLIIE